jgi:cytochrome c-type biogenesis protein CcmH
MGGAADPHGNIAVGGAARSPGSVSGTVSVAPKLSVAPSDVLYLIARKGNSTLAVRRVDKPTFPFAFEISGADVMMSGVAFDGPLDLVARVSRTGDAIPSKGDIEGTIRNVKVPAQGVKLTIDSVRE